MDDTQQPERSLTLPRPFSLALTCGPVAWVGHRSPRHAWRDGTLTWVGWEEDRLVWRQVRQVGPATVAITANRDVSGGEDAEWGSRVLGSDIVLPSFRDPVIRTLAERFVGLRPYCDGSLFDGLVTSIVGQSISVAAAAVTQARLAALFTPAVWIDDRAFHPLPRPDHLADASPTLIRQSGVTMRRAEALRHAARAAIAGELPDDVTARRDPMQSSSVLRNLPLVGRWTAESSLLWGVGAADAYPAGDVALLRAARLVHARPELTLRTLDDLAEAWRPARGLAARLLWTELLGAAPGGDRFEDMT